MIGYLVMLPSVVEQTAGGLVGAIREGFQSRNWGLVIGAALSLLVLLAKPLLARWGQLDGVKPFLPWITMAVAVAVSVGSALMSGGDVWQSAVEALQASGIAVLLWETAGKMVRNKIRPK